MNKRVWDAARVCRRLKRWIVANNERVSVDGRELLQRIAEASSDAYAGATDFRLQSIMYASRGLVGLMAGDMTALDLMYRATNADRCGLIFSAAYFYFYLPDVTPTCSINTAALDLARAVALGCTSEAEIMADIMWRGLNDGLFYDGDQSRVVPFVLQLYAESRGIPVPTTKFASKKDPRYERLLEMWDSPDASRLIPALSAACDLHIERSKSTTDREDYEFNDSEFNLQPVELLMVMRLREYMKLAIPRIDHPVMDTPVARLYPVRSFGPDRLIEAALAVELARVESKKKLQGAN